jgi:glycine cleavage system protein P-like pyridoxal-binding family
MSGWIMNMAVGAGLEPLSTCTVKFHPRKASMYLSRRSVLMGTFPVMMACMLVGVSSLFDGFDDLSDGFVDPDFSPG